MSFEQCWKITLEKHRLETQYLNLKGFFMSFEKCWKITPEKHRFEKYLNLKGFFNVF